MYRISPAINVPGGVLVLDAPLRVRLRSASWQDDAEWLGEISTNLRRKTLVPRVEVWPNLSWMPTFTCQNCGTTFALPQRVLDRYPNWVPKLCMDCRETQSEKTAGDDGPHTGVFTDGSASPNPGPGGWGAVYVIDDEIISEAFGSAEHTTNNRMELTALIAALDLVPEGTPMTVYSDSNLAVRTINEWAAGWKKRGWKRKTGPVENVDLVRKAYEAWRTELKLEWIKGHAGYRWNEYADELANRWRD